MQKADTKTPARWPFAAFVAVVIAALAVPLAFMPVASSGIENDDAAAAWPALFDENGFNWDFLSEAGAYFEDHYAFRGELMTANAKLEGEVFSTSSVDDVIWGDDEWLFYSATLGDYMGTASVGDGELLVQAYNMALMQEYVESVGASFAVAFVPNKNSVYGDFMPARYLASDKPHDIETLEKMCEAAGVDYVKLMQPYTEWANESDYPLYYQKDTHWNGYGCLLAYEEIMDAVGKEHATYDLEDMEMTRHEGDLERMLFPGTDAREWMPYQLDSPLEPEYIEGERLDGIARFEAEGTGTFAMFNDSFGAAMFKPIANNYATSYFSWNRSDLGHIAQWKPDAVVVLHTERNVHGFFEELLCFPALTVDDVAVDVQSRGDMAEDAIASVQAEDAGVYVKISGQSNALGITPEELACGRADAAYVSLDGGTTLHKAYRHADGRFQLFVAADEVGDATALQVQVFRQNGNEAELIGTTAVALS